MKMLQSENREKKMLQSENRREENAGGWGTGEQGNAARLRTIGISTRLRDRPRNQGSISGRGTRHSLLNKVQTGFEAHLASYRMVTADCSPGGKRPKRETDHSPPPFAEVKNCGATPPFSTRLYGVVLN
jgi:hypothetical protein